MKICTTPTSNATVVQVFPVKGGSRPVPSVEQICALLDAGLITWKVALANPGRSARGASLIERTAVRDQTSFAALQESLFEDSACHLYRCAAILLGFHIAHR